MFNLSFISSCLLSISIYNLQLLSADGSKIDLIQFKGKKMLIVNTATISQYANQFSSLEQLYRQYKDSLVILAIPSNDFGNEGAENAVITKAVVEKYHPSYILAAKLSVKGVNISPLYKWLAESAQNGSLDGPVIGDFQKYLIDSNGRISGVFAGSVDPMDSVIQQAITGTY